MTPNIDQQINQNLTLQQWRDLLTEHADEVFIYFTELIKQPTIEPVYIEAILIVFPLVMPTNQHKEWTRLLTDIFFVVQAEAKDETTVEANHTELDRAIKRGLKRARKRIPLPLIFDLYADLFAYYVRQGGVHNVELVLASNELAHLINHQPTYVRLYAELARAYLAWERPEKAQDQALSAWHLSQQISPRKSKAIIPLLCEVYIQLGEPDMAKQYQRLMG